MEQGYDDRDDYVGAGFSGSRGNGGNSGGYRSGGYNRSNQSPRPNFPNSYDMLNGPCDAHSYMENGVKKSNHSMKDCRHFQRMTEAYQRLQHGNNGNNVNNNNGCQVQPGAAPAVPGTPALGAPPAPPLQITGNAHQTAAADHQEQLLPPPPIRHSTDNYPPAINNIYMIQESCPASHNVSMIQKGRPANRCQKLITR